MPCRCGDLPCPSHAESASGRQGTGKLAGAVQVGGGVWHAGHRVDCLGTAFYHDREFFGWQPDLDTLFAWLDAHCDPDTGLWGKGDRHDCVNGFYRLTRGTYAQFERPLPYPEKTIDTVLAHAATPRSLQGRRALPAMCWT